MPERESECNGVYYYTVLDVKVQTALMVRQARGDRLFVELARALDTSSPSASARKIHAITPMTPC